MTRGSPAERRWTGDGRGGVEEDDPRNENPKVGVREEGGLRATPRQREDPVWTRGSSARWASGLAFAILLFVSCSSTTSPAQFPNMLGIWTGTFTFVRSINPPGASNTCTMSWTVTSQSAGQYSGVYQLTGGTPDPCGSIGNVSGSVSTGGNISSLTFSTPFGIVSMC